MRVLVTGGAGYIGSVIVDELAKAGHIPIVYDSMVTGHYEALPPDVPLVAGDVRDTELIARTLTEQGIEAVIHMAGLIEVGLSVTNPHSFFEVNVGGTLSVLRAMLDVGVKRFVFSSTAALYGDPERLPITEEDLIKPTNPYGQSKYMVEQMLLWDTPVHGLICTSLRYFNAAGATERSGEMHQPETHLIPLVLRSAAEGRPFSLYGSDYPTRDGTTIRDYVHVVDLAQSHILALRRDEPGLRIYNVGNGNGYSVREVIAAAREVTGLPLQVEERPRREGDQVATVASSERIRRELGWEPRHASLHDILGSAWQWRQRHPHGYAR